MSICRPRLATFWTLPLLVSVGLACGTPENGQCLRNSDCASGLVCSQSGCVAPASDAGLFSDGDDGSALDGTVEGAAADGSDASSGDSSVADAGGAGDAADAADGGAAPDADGGAPDGASDGDAAADGGAADAPAG